MVAVQAANALADGEDGGVFAVLALGAAVCGSYALYRLVDRLDRGDRLAAVTFTVVYGLIGLVATGLLLANQQAGASWGDGVIAVLEVTVPTLFMALAPWVLVRIVEIQQGPSARPPLPSLGSPWLPTTPPGGLPESRPPDPATGLVANGSGAPAVNPGRRRPSATTLAGLAAVGCLVIALAWLIGSSGVGTGPESGPAKLSHDAPEVEALLPASVAGRPLAVWSVRGEAALRLWGMTPDEIRAARGALAATGVDLDDIVQATAGRSDIATDPPYFVLAHRIPAPARDLLGGRAVASVGFTRDTADWEGDERVIGGKAVWVGSPDLVVQSEHQRGRPYLYGSVALDTSFTVITDDERWAEEAIGLLPE